MMFSLYVNAQPTTINYTESTSIIANPERGLQKYSSTASDGITSPLTTFSYNQLSQSTLTGWRTSSDRVTVVYRYFILPSVDLNTTYLDNMQTDFNRIRNAGLKCIIRFAYTNDCNSGCDNGTNPQQPSKAQILDHIEQLSNVVNTNKDVIFSIQAGFIGTWGEWYYTGSSEFGHEGANAAQYQNRKNVVDAMLANFDTDIPLQVRYADAKREMYGNAIPSDFGQDRIGFYNDSFLNNWGDSGTYNISNSCQNPVGTADYSFISNTSRFLPMTGETNGINPCSPSRTLGSNAVLEMNFLSFTTLNRDYYTQNWNNWISSGHYEDILKGLGYRFILTSSTLNNNNLTLNVYNDGFATVLSEKNFYVVFRQGATDIKRLLSEDVRYWGKGSNTINITLPTDLADGSYELLLHIADKNLENRPEYSIQLANTGLWEAATGYNRLNQTYEVLNASCAQTATWTGTNWIGGVTPTIGRNVIINGNYNTAINGPGSFDACNLTVNGNLTVHNSGFVTVENDIVVNSPAELIVESGGKLIPLNEWSTSTGIVSVKRNTTFMKRFDYTYFSSPVATTIGSALPITNWQFNRIREFYTPNFYDVETVFPNGDMFMVPDGQDDNGDAWLPANELTPMVAGKGFAAMIKSNPATGIYPRVETVTFVGELNTGIIEYDIHLSANNLSNTDDWNLIGNPYSSSIDANEFINENIDNISGVLAYWTHTGTLSSAYPGLQENNFSTSDYAYYNLLGGTATASTTGNPSGFGGKIPTKAIGSGQAFLVTAETDTIVRFFPTFMNKVLDNSTDLAFFRNSEINNVDEDKKIWLNMSTELGLFSQQLIGYNEVTSLNYEKGWDYINSAPRRALKFYSIESDTIYKIQARGQFDETDVVKLGYFTAVAETFTISVDSIVGIENVYIKDYGVIHELPYTFSSEIGEYNDRFELVYQNSLSNPDWNIKDIFIYPNSTSNYVNIVVENIEDYKINLYNSLGQRLNVIINDKKLQMEHLSSGVYILEIIDENIKRNFKILNK